MKAARYLSAKEAAKALNVSMATVYSYVSRGLIHSEPLDTYHRAHGYLADDVEQLIERKEYRRHPRKATQATMHWGMPVLESALTLITDAGPRYRGYDALHLATTARIEQVAALLWTGDTRAERRIFTTLHRMQQYFVSLQALDVALTPLQKAQVALALAAGGDLAIHDVHAAPERLAESGGHMLTLLTAIMANTTKPSASLARTLSDGWGVAQQQATDLLNAALILCADHELNTSSFTARVVASAGADLPLAVSAGLAAVQGFRHGGNTALVEGLLREVGEPRRAQRIIARRLRRGEMLPGFGQRLYPNGDPRATLLLRLTAQAMPNAPIIALTDAVIEAAEVAIGKKPNLELGLVTLAQALQLPEGSALALFALGRTVGLIAHALEQYHDGRMIRPRATYIGPGET